MGRYKYTVWLGKGKEHYWNWEMKGIPNNDYSKRLEAVEECFEGLKAIREFYQHLLQAHQKQEGIK